MTWTTDDLVAAVRRSGWLPNAGDIAATDLLAWGDEELRGAPGALLKKAREEHRVVTTDIALVAGTARYRIPRRALGRAVRGISYVDASGNVSPANEISPLDAWQYTRFVALDFYFEGDELVLPAAPTSSEGSIRVRYMTRPSRMVEVAQAGRITAVGSTTTLTLASAPAWASLLDGNAYVDIVRGDSPFPTSFEDRIMTTLTGADVTLDTSTPVVVADIAVEGITHERIDYLCRRDETVYPPLPEEMHSLLMLAICFRALISQKDFDGAAAVRAEYQRHESAARTQLEPRNAARRRPIVNRSSALRTGGRRRW